MVLGHYVFEPGRAGDDWRVRRLKLQTSDQTGNAGLLEEAVAK